MEKIKVTVWGVSLFINVLSIYDLIACMDESNACKFNSWYCEEAPKMRADCPKTCGDCKGNFLD